MHTSLNLTLLLLAFSVHSGIGGGAQCADIETLVNGLQVKGGLFGREFTKSLMFRDFDDVLENSFRYVHLFLLHTLLSKKIAENRHA